MAIQASQVSTLRQMTGCGMMDCKKALEEAGGNLDQAADVLRKKGMAKAAKKASRVAKEGVIKLKVSDDKKQAAMIEVNSETDFVARDENFQRFADQVAAIALAQQTENIEALTQALFQTDKTVDQARQDLIVTLGENMTVRRVALLKTSAQIGAYVHGDRLGAMVAIEGGDATLAKDLAMHIVASHPLVILPDQIASEVIQKEKEICRIQALKSGKPEQIVDKIVTGRIQKFKNEISLVTQPFVKNPDITVADLLKEKQANVQAFVRFELGEGIEKIEKNFAAEVMNQIKDN